MEQWTKAREADAGEIMRLYRACARSGKIDGSSDWDDEYPDEESMREQLREERLYVLRGTDGIRASVAILPTDDLDEEDIGWSKGDSLVLCRLCVRPDLQGHGIGARVVGLAMARMREMGARYAHLMTPLDNRVAQAMYKKLDFRRLGVRNLYDMNFVLYEKEIPQSAQG